MRTRANKGELFKKTDICSKNGHFLEKRETGAVFSSSEDSQNDSASGWEARQNDG